METVKDFTANDRCDRCGSQAYHLATHLNGTDLLFCAHHLTKHHDKLLKDGFTIESDITGLESIGFSPVSV
jgi:hypothetical protein